MGITSKVRASVAGVSSALLLALCLLPTSVASAKKAPSPPPPSSAPVVSIVSPANDTTVSKNSTVTIVASASDDVAVTQIDFYVVDVFNDITGSTLVCSGTASTCNWHTPNKDGMFELIAVAHDGDGNSTLSSSVIVRVL